MAAFLESFQSAVNRFRERRARYRSAFALAALLVLTEVVYLRPGILSGALTLDGADYDQLHIRRLAFARQALSGVRHSLPAWNPHEVLGAPFAANLQGFPWIPTRLLLLALDPAVAYAAGVAMAAALAAIFTWLYCRRAGMSRTSAVAAGWTFACAGYFSSRVLAGHLPLLEAYPALPLLLWMVDRALAPERRHRHHFDLAALALCCTFVVAAGHPQVPAYALTAAFLYVVCRGRSTGRIVRVRVATAMALGIGMALVFWWPMLQLIGRSTRIQHLAAPDNDVVMPYSRLAALIVPGIHGWPDPVELADKNPFTGYLNSAWFWDTASYVGILPLLAIVGLFVACIVRRRMPGWRGKYLVCLGVGALFCSLPVAASLLHALPGTFLRSPARLLYLSTFCAAVALGAGVDAVRGAAWPRKTALRNAALAVALALHFVDLRGFAHWFIQTSPRTHDAPAFQATLDRETGSGRIAEERDELSFSYGDRYDDAGGFDSIFLARFNRGYLALAGLPADTNEQVFDASVLPAKALAAMGVRFAITPADRTDLELAGKVDDANLYRVANPAPRASFFAAERAEFMPEREIPEAFAADSRDRLLLAAEVRRLVTEAGSGGPNSSAALDYTRPSSDEIVVTGHAYTPGFVYVLEAYDPGWKALADGARAEVLPANGFAMAIPVARGPHLVQLRYETPGRATGLYLSLLSLSLLAGLIAASKEGGDPIN